MWVAEFKVWHTGSASQEITKKYGTTIESHYLNTFTIGKKDYVTKVLVMRGENNETVKKEYLREEKKRGCKSIAIEGNQIFLIAPAVTQFHATVLGSKTFFVRPQLIKDGHVYWTVASWDKKHLMNLYKKIKKLPKTKATIELLSLKQETVPIFASSLMSALTEKQRAAFELATKEGYYAYPRKISLEELAEKAGIAYTTFKDRLRTAEGKLWPSLVS